MPNITITNLTSEAVFLSFLYTTIPAGENLTTYRASTDLMGEPHFHELIQNGTLSVDIDYTEEERGSYFDIFPGFSLPEGLGAPPSHRRYVDINAPDEGDGSILNPYNLIQVAIDDLETLDNSEVTIIYIEPGEYPEALVIHQPNIILISKAFTAYYTGAAVWINPTDLWGLTLTNATPESLAAYDISGDYGDLVNQGDSGPNGNKFKGIYFNGSSDVAGVIRLLGVKGDYSPDLTEFARSTTFEHGRVRHTGTYPYGLYAKNCGDIIFAYTECSQGTHRTENTLREYHRDGIACDVNMTYDPADPHGSHRYGIFPTLYLDRASISQNRGDSIIDNSSGSGGAYLLTIDSFLGFRWESSTQRSFTVNGPSGYVQLYNTNSHMDLILSGDMDLRARNAFISGDLELQSGPGVVDFEGGGWSRELTDPDEKLSPILYKNVIYPSIVTSGVIAKASQRIRYDTSGGTFQIDAPASPVPGDSFSVKEYANNATNITVDGNGNNIEHPLTGVKASSAVFGAANIGVTWEYDGSNWIIP